MIDDQPPPNPGQGDMWAKVMEDMADRREMGMARYGTPLQAFNGRDSLIDLYQELLDATVYIRQAIEEQMVQIGCRHKPDCPHYCQEGHFTGDEMTMVDIDRIYWKEAFEKLVEFVRKNDPAMLDAYVFTERVKDLEHQGLSGSSEKEGP